MNGTFKRSNLRLERRTAASRNVPSPIISGDISAYLTSLKTFPVRIKDVCGRIFPMRFSRPTRPHVLILAVALLAARLSHAAPPGTIRLPADADEHAFSDLAKVALPAAIRTAQRTSPGPVIWAGYENSDGFL